VNSSDPGPVPTAAPPAKPVKGEDLKLGDTAPEIDLLDQSGKRHRLEDYSGKGVVLFFYPQDETPGCTQEACDFKANYDKILKKRAVVLGVSPDSADSHKNFKKNHDLPFPLLVDDKNRLSKAYGVWDAKKGIRRSTFVIGEGGKISRIYRDVKVPGHVKTLLDAA
jgi:peroxiredoxin Q/BCP